MKFFLPLFFSIAIVTLSLSKGFSQSEFKAGTWNCTLQLQKDAALPFILEVKDSLKEKKPFIVNGEEKIPVQSFKQKGDSIFIVPSVFQTEIRAKLISNSLSGIFIDHARVGEYIIPFRAELKTVPEKKNNFIPNWFYGKWEVHFSPQTADSSSAIGIFDQRFDTARGTFLTTTGDYRFLIGRVKIDTVTLSAFDGAHLFLFIGVLNYNTIDGMFWSGKHWTEPWTATRNENYKLPDASSLTFLKKGFDKISFSFPDKDSSIISMSDERFKNKVTLVQITGTWCPNCMDETRVLIPLYNSLHSKGLETVALDFERKDDWNYVRTALTHEQEVFNLPYPIVFGGLTKNSSASLPMLNTILGYPTLIIIDKKGIVRKIITGIDGPATGDLYEKWRDNFQNTVEQLLAE